MARKLSEHTIAAVHVLHLLELVQRWQVTERDLLAGFGLRAQTLKDASATLSMDTMVEVLERARALTGEPGLGVYLGLQARASGHGYLGFAAMSAPMFRDAIALAIRFVPIRTTAFTLRGQIEGEAASLIIEEHADLGPARDTLLFALLIGLRQIGCALTGRELDLAIDLAIDEPAYFARFAHALPVTRFGQPENRLTGRAAGLDSPLVLADPEGLALAREQCERLLATLGLDGRIAARARAVLTSDDRGFLSLDEVATKLGTSTRTLRRRLEAEGAPFAALLRDAREAQARKLLGSRELSIDEVAARLGYSNSAAFTRAFVRWAGETPSAFRKRAAR